MSDPGLIAKLDLTPLGAAVYQGQLTEALRLLDEGADIRAQAGAGRSYVLHWARDVSLARALIERGADVNAQDAAYKSVLYWHAKYPDRNELIRLLHENGADPNRACVQGVTPLHRAA